MINLKEKYFSLAEKYIHNAPEKLAHWKEIEENYSSPQRHYHTLSHLKNMFMQLEGAWKYIEDAEIVSWAVFYHDLIYDVQRNDNEERSADSAFALLMSYGMTKKKCLLVHNMIVATKTHESSSHDTDYFLDADLSVLGADAAIYQQYVDNVRKEFKNIPDPLFRAGRKNILEQFLKRDRIFKTPYFYDRLEENARKNISLEINSMATA